MKKNRRTKIVKSKVLAFLLAFAMVASNAGSGLNIAYAEESGIEESKAEESEAEESEAEESKAEESKAEESEAEEREPEESKAEESKAEESKAEESKAEESEPEESKAEESKAEESKAEESDQKRDTEPERNEEEGSQFLSTVCEGVTIRVEAVTGKLNPEIAEIAATVVTDEAMHTAMKKAAAEAGKVYSETKLFDIVLLNADGEEVQPKGKVKVIFEDQALTDEKVESDSQTMEVVCLKENKNGEAYVSEKLNASLDEVSGTLEFETNHFTVYGYGAEAVAAALGDVEYDLSSKWDVDYPALAAKTTEGIAVEVSKIQRGKAFYPAKITYTIPEGFSGEIRINAMMDIAEAMSGEPAYLPGDAAACEVEIVNHSKQEYTYDNNSFIIATEDNEEAVKNGSGGALPVSEDLDVRSFDGTLMPLQYSARRVRNKALQALYGVSSPTNIEDNWIKDAALDIKLKAYQNDDGGSKYPEGIKQLNQYYLDFYNAEYQTSFTKLEEFSDYYADDNAKKMGLDVLGDGIFGGYGSRVTETNPELASVSYNYFYNHLMLVYPAGMDRPVYASEMWDQYTVGQTMRNISKGTSTLFEETCREAWGSIESGAAKSIDGFEFTFHGPATGNAYQGYNLGFALGFTLKEVPQKVYTLTINYYEKGTLNKLMDSVDQIYKEGENLTYDITQLVNGVSVNGYTYNSWENLQLADLSGTIGQNLVFNVYFTKNAANNPGSGGNNGGNGGGSIGDGGKTPTGPGLAAIPENEIPLAAYPETPGDLITIIDSEVPLAALPKTSDQGGKKGAITIVLSGMILALYVLQMKKREKKQ